MAIDPENLADYIGRRGPTLHHVTTREAVDSIREHGLVPGSQRGYRIHNGFFATRAEHVYLGDLLTVGVVEVPGERVLLAVDLRHLEPELIDPDEDEVQQSYFRSDGPWLPHHEHPPIRQMDGNEEAPGQDGVLAAWADTTEGFDAPEITTKSLQRGRIAYRGTIQAVAIDEVHLPSEAAEHFAVGVVPILGPGFTAPIAPLLAHAEVEVRRASALAEHMIDVCRQELDLDGDPKPTTFAQPELALDVAAEMRAHAKALRHAGELTRSTLPTAAANLADAVAALEPEVGWSATRDQCTVIGEAAAACVGALVELDRPAAESAARSAILAVLAV